MMRIPSLKFAFRKLFFLLAAIAWLSFSAKSQVVISPVTTQNGNIVTADFLVYNFTDIISMQFSIHWDPAEMSFQSIHSFNLPDLTAANFGIWNPSSGTLTMSWFDQTTSGIDQTPCASIFSINFLLTGTDIPPVTVNGTPIVIEVTNINGSVPVLISSACTDAGQLKGKVFYDQTANCQNDSGEPGLEDWKVKVDGSGYTFYSTSNADGDYYLYLLPGSYDVSIIPPNSNLWEPCQASQTITISENQETAADFPVQALMDCPWLEVDIATPLLRRCFDANYYVQYCNHGTITADDAYIEVTFDSYLTVNSSSLPWTSVSGSTYTFPVGDVAVGVCSGFYLQVGVSCDAVLGQTHCTSAHIYPDSLCIPPDPLWDGSNLDVTATCDGDSVHFEIINTGDDMDSPVNFIVIEDDMIMMTSDPIQLQSLQSTVAAFSANGVTWRLEVNQTPYNPATNLTTATVEGCGTNGNGTFSIGFVTQYPLGDESPFIDIDCRENVGSYDPNDKMGFPKGFCQEHHIEAETPIDYLIRFQNTGTDTAFTVVVRDTLPAFLDPASVVPGVSSHSYDYELLGAGVVQFTFDNIMLPDSSANEAASHGFVKFKVAQRPGNVPGNVIQNKAAIVFDFNDPVITNIYYHTVGENFIPQGQTGEFTISGFVHALHGGAPVDSVQLHLSNGCPAFTDDMGYYIFTEIDSGGYALYATKVNKQPTKGVTVLDAIKIRNYVLGIQQFTSPYDLKAADLNKSNSVTTFDLVVMYKLILGHPVTLNLDWVFADAAYVPVFPSTVFPTIINFNNFVMSVDSVNFTGIQPGNVLDESEVGISPRKTRFKLIPGPTLQNQTIQVAVKAKEFLTVHGFQFGLKWDPAILSIAEVQTGKLPNFTSTNHFSPSPGRLSLVWQTSSQGITAAEDSTLFTITFNVLAPVGSNTLLSLDETNVPLQVVVEECKLVNAALEEATIVVEAPTATSGRTAIDFKASISPNPVAANQSVLLKLQMERAGELGFHIFDVNGNSIAQLKREFTAGASAFQWSPALAKGVYLLKITNEEGEANSLRLVVI